MVGYGDRAAITQNKVPCDYDFEVGLEQLRCPQGGWLRA
jgi:hypothetical protein